MFFCIPVCIISNTKIAKTQDEINAVAKVIVGGFGAKNTVNSRLSFARYANYAQVDITGTQKEQFDIAKKDFTEISPKLNYLFDVQLPALEKEFVELGGVLHNKGNSGRSWFED